MGVEGRDGGELVPRPDLRLVARDQIDRLLPEQQAGRIDRQVAALEGEERRERRRAEHRNLQLAGRRSEARHTFRCDRMVVPSAEHRRAGSLPRAVAAWRRLGALSMLLVATICVLALRSDGPELIAWAKDWNEAAARSRAERKPILVRAFFQGPVVW